MTYLLLTITVASVLIISTKCSPSDSQFIGLGYNILYGNPDGGDHSQRGVDPGIKSTRRIIKVTPSTARHLIVNDGKTSCVPSNTTSIFYGGKSYQDYLMSDIVTLGPGDATITPYAFTQSQVFKDIQQRTTGDHDVFRDSITVCNTGKTRYIMPPLYPDEHDVTDEFASAVCNLPIDYDKTTYKQFLDTWGTHVIVGVESGIKTVKRYQQSTSQLADILFTYDIGVGRVSVEEYLGYGSVVHLNVSNLHHSDYQKIQGGKLDASMSLGTPNDHQPVSYTLATIARVMKEEFFLNASLFQASGLCGEGVTYYLPRWQNNTLRALAEYAKDSGSLYTPQDPDIRLPVTWPHGTYGFYKPRAGCPKSPIGFSEGWRRQDAEDDDNTNYWTSTIHLAGVMEHNKPVFYFCVKTANENSKYERDWPSGNYCILKKGGCPTGFSGGSVFWDDEDASNANGHGGVLPDGDYGSNTRIDFCCRNDGKADKEILLPVDRPFYLMRYTGECQKVFGMSVVEEVFSIDTENTFNRDSCSGAHPYDPHCSRNHELHYCYYEIKPAVNFPPQIFG